MEQRINYNELIDKAMRGLVKEVLTQVQREGMLPGNHHFYISFRTAETDVTLSSVLRKDYPEEMTIVLQHRFKDLVVNETGFAVTLWFHGKDERLRVPFSAITAFADPIIPFSVQFGKHTSGSGGTGLTGEARAGRLPLSQPSVLGQSRSAAEGKAENVISLKERRKERTDPD